MKKSLLLLLAVCCLCAAKAQSCVSIRQVATNHAARQVTFDLKWTVCNNTNHHYRVWVFVDYRPVTAFAKGAWSRAVITHASTGTLHPGNGVWLTGSANATRRLTLTLDVAPAQFDWCAFAVDYPPNAVLSLPEGVYTLSGAVPFLLNGHMTWSANTYAGGHLATITDATGHPEGLVLVPGCAAGTVLPGSSGFVSADTWQIGAQTWSAPLTATYCRKTTFDGGSSSAFHADCRANNGKTNTTANLTHGDLFSWCMVARHALFLCPAGWRVPTKDDFTALDLALGGTGANNQYSGALRAAYLNTWGGSNGGYAHAGTLFDTGWHAYFWSQTAHNAAQSAHLAIFNHNRIDPQRTDSKQYGYALRCVR